MLDTVRTLAASLIIASAVVSSSTPQSLQRPSTETLQAVAQRGKELLAALRDYTYCAELTIQTISQSDTYWFPAYTTADDRIRVGRYFVRVVVNLRFSGYKKVSGPMSDAQHCCKLVSDAPRSDRVSEKQ